MKKLLKKNQVIITALAIMIAVAGYLNFTSDKQVLNTSVEDMESEGASGNSDDATVSAAVEDTVEGQELALENAADVEAAVEAETDILEQKTEEIVAELAADETDMDVAEASLDENGDPIDSDRVGETVLTNASVSLSQAKLNREQTRSKAKEMLLEIINNDSLSEDSKKDAINKMLAMTERMEKETAAETQLTAKGFADSIVSISDDSVDVTLSISELTDTQRTQIEDIITRKTGCELNQIVITTTN
ncbi:MAG: SpoIIIAH-like family protein [Clostridium sp.]|nr:SpoIIIAH-like family protein [Clostridium sp.]